MPPDMQDEDDDDCSDVMPTMKTVCGVMSSIMVLRILVSLRC